jgi:alpha-glucosidase
MNFGSEPAELPAGTVLLSSTRLRGRQLPAETTVWLQQGVPPLSLD